MKIIRTHEADPEAYTPFEREMIYNGLDVCVTRDCLDAMLPQLDEHTEKTYEFSKALQGPTLEMRVRGVLVDQARKAEVIDEYYAIIETLEAQLERIVLDGVGLPSFNWRSHRDLHKLFYDTFGLPPVRKAGRPTTDRGAREKLGIYPIAEQIIKHINTLTELGDKISVLKTDLDSDGRIRTSYNIAGTSTGRFSSSFSEFGTGGNLQNIEESLRSIFIADHGYKFAKCDAKSGESFAVGGIEWNLFHDGRYLDMCETGDPHTAIARVCWPGDPWTGDIKKDAKIAGAPFYRHHSKRQTTKKVGHASNYAGKPNTIATQTGMPLELIKNFQPIYFKTFPAHEMWHEYVDNTLRKNGYLISLTGRKRWFFGRRGDADTLRGAIAFDPQCSLADIVNTAMLNIWRKGYVIICMHEHDALTFMYPEKHENKIIPQLLNDLIVPIQLAHGRTLRIPYDCKVGWNKGEYDATKNPNGLKDYHGTDDRKRQKEAGILDRIVRRANR